MLGNLNECIITSGKLVLDSYYNLSRKSFSLVELKQMKEYLEVTHYEMQRLFCFKQYLLGSNKNNSTAIKPHMVHHFIYEMTQTGSTNNTNTRTSEQKHVIVKGAWKASSHRQGTSGMKELGNRLETARVIQKASELYDEIYGPFQIDRVSAPITRSNHVLFKGNDENVTFECSILNTDKEELTYYARTRKLIPTTASNLKYLNPLINLDSIWAYLENFEELQPFLDNFRNKNKGMF